jgi:hypothetical protein
MKRNKGTSVLSVLGGFVLFFLACGSLFALGLFFRGCNVANRLADDAANTTVKEFAPSAMLRKYEWFKDTAAALDAKKASIEVYEARFASTKTSYGADATKWPRDVRENLAQQLSEVAGIKASFNNLAAEYNADMVKFNWSVFERFGDAPKGAREVLPREFKPYIVS